MLRAVLPASLTAITAQRAADHTINVLLGALIVIGTISSVTKILWDRKKKQDQRARLSELEQENRELIEERAKLHGQLEILQQQAKRPQ